MSTYSKHFNSIETTFTLTLLDLTIMYNTPFLNENTMLHLSNSIAI